MDPLAHNGVYLGDCAHTDGIYIWDQDHPEQPVRISRNFLSRSFHEQCTITSEPIRVSDNQYELLKDEVNQLKNNSFENDCDDPPVFDLTNVLKECLEHWKNMQQFVKLHREWYAQQSTLSPEEAEQKVQEEWKLREIKHVEAAMHAHMIEQQLEQAQEAAQSALSKPAVTVTDTQPASAEDLKLAIST